MSYMLMKVDKQARPRKSEKQKNWLAEAWGGPWLLGILVSSWEVATNFVIML